MPDRKLDDLVKRLQEAKKNKEVTSIGYHGNIVTVWERLVEHMQETGERLVDLGSDQVGEAIGHFKMMPKFSEIHTYFGFPKCMFILSDLSRRAVTTRSEAVTTQFS